MAAAKYWAARNSKHVAVPLLLRQPRETCGCDGALGVDSTIVDSIAKVPPTLANTLTHAGEPDADLRDGGTPP